VRRFALVVLLLTLTYALVLGSFHAWDLAMGAIVSGALLYALRGFVFGGRPERPNGSFRRLAAFVPFLFAILREVVVGTWEVALVTLHLRPIESPGIVAIPVGDRTPTGVAVSALATTLSPGTFLVDVDWERRAFLIHTIDASDPDAVRQHHQDFYERYQRAVFP
jgi:multicomponent Na+:H+ antiporter subunit E